MFVTRLLTVLDAIPRRWAIVALPSPCAISSRTSLARGQCREGTRPGCGREHAEGVARDAWAEHGAAGGHRADRAEHLLRIGILEYVSAGPRRPTDDVTGQVAVGPPLVRHQLVALHRRDRHRTSLARDRPRQARHRPPLLRDRPRGWWLHPPVPGCLGTWCPGTRAAGSPPWGSPAHPSLSGRGPTTTSCRAESRQVGRRPSPSWGHDREARRVSRCSRSTRTRVLLEACHASQMMSGATPTWWRWRGGVG